MNNELDTNSITTPHHEICLQLQRHDIWNKVDWHFFGEIETEAIRALYKDPHLREGDLILTIMKDLKKNT